MTTAAAEGFLWLSTLYSVCLSRVGGGKERRGGVRVLVRLADGVLLFLACVFSLNDFSAVSQSKEKLQICVQKHQTHGFVSKKVHGSFEECIIAI